MTILIDSREQDPLLFSTIEGIDISKETIDVGDYSARISGEVVPVRIERKSIADLFGSFSSGYDNEKKKIGRAKEAGYKYILAIEGTIFDVRQGHSYTKNGELMHSKKDGLSQVKQLMTMYHKGYFDIWWCRSRQEMAFMIVQYFLAVEKLKREQLTGRN